MSSIFLSQDTTDPENVHSSASNDFLTLASPFKYIICEEYSLDGNPFNASIDHISSQHLTMQGNYSEILDRLASSLDSPTIYSKQKYSSHTGQISSTLLPHHTEPICTSRAYTAKHILMSSSNETLFETPKDDCIELNSDTAHDTESKIIKDCRSELKDLNYRAKFACPIDGCRKVFTRKANRRAHIETHNPNRARPFACSKCLKSYLRSIDLMRHIDTTHDKTQKHLCPDCGRSFTRKEGLRKHQERGICSSSQFSPIE